MPNFRTARAIQRPCLFFVVLFGWFFETGFSRVALALLGTYSVDQAVLELERFACLCLPSAGFN